MNKDELNAAVHAYVESSPENYIDKAWAEENELDGIRMYDNPLVGYASAADPLFSEFQKESVVGPHMLLPRNWVKDAETVVSIFLPLSSEIRSSNRSHTEWPSKAWLYARIEGQCMINALSAHIVDYFGDEGFTARAPSIDSAFASNSGVLQNTSVVVTTHNEEPIPAYSSNWSERHVAYACGLGTFSLSKGLITSRGVAGRFTSLITNWKTEPTVRKYTDLHEYCSLCGVCAKNCPAGAISLESGKDHELCAAYLKSTKKRFSPRYGCGKCQTYTPCESKPCGRARKADTF